MRATAASSPIRAGGVAYRHAEPGSPTQPPQRVRGPDLGREEVRRHLDIDRSRGRARGLHEGEASTSPAPRHVHLHDLLDEGSEHRRLIDHLVQGAPVDAVAPSVLGMSVARTTIGDLPAHASPTAPRVLAAPGPVVVSATPHRPVARRITVGGVRGGLLVADRYQANRRTRKGSPQGEVMNAGSPKTTSTPADNKCLRPEGPHRSTRCRGFGELPRNLPVQRADSIPELRARAWTASSTSSDSTTSEGRKRTDFSPHESTITRSSSRICRTTVSRSSVVGRSTAQRRPRPRAFGDQTGMFRRQAARARRAALRPRPQRAPPDRRAPRPAVSRVPHHVRRARHPTSS